MSAQSEHGTVDNPVPIPRSKAIAVRAFVFVAVLGPLFGGVPYFVLFSYERLRDGQLNGSPEQIAGFAQAAGRDFLFVTAYAYAFGLIAALLCAAIMAISVYKRGDIGFLASLAAGVVAALFSSMVLVLLTGRPLSDGVVTFTAIQILPGAFAAALCWGLMRQFGWVGISKTHKLAKG